MTDTSTLPWEVRGFHSWYSAVRAHQLCERELRQVLKPMGLTLTQYEILANIAHAPGVSQQDLSERLAMTRNNVSTSLAELERRDLVTRVPDPDDRRIRRLALAPSAAPLMKEALAEHAKVVERMMRDLTDHEIEVMGEANDRVLRSFGIHLRRDDCVENCDGQGK